MFRRWLIRGTALTLLALCVVAWAASYLTTVWVEYDSPMWGWSWSLESGTLRANDVRSLDGKMLQLGAHGWSAGWREANQLMADPPPFLYRLGGFGYWSQSLTEYGHRSVCAPVWLPTLLSAVLLWLIWRKTRPAHSGRGFPVEAAGKEATKP
jgi:hypothetical protein